MAVSTTMLMILPPPLDWVGPSQIFSALSGYPYYKNIEAAGLGYQNFLRRRRGEDVSEEKKKEDDDDDDISSEEQARFKHKKHKKALESNSLEDPYEIMGLDHLRWRATDDDIKSTFRKLVLLYHPDKMDKKDKTEVDDEIFKRISKANDTLCDPKKRRALDSNDEFDDSIPTGNEKGDFFDVFGPVFHRFSRWSSIQPAPLIGDSADDYEVVATFYEFWYAFKSWRDYSFEDEYNLDEAESRDERRWMEKQNERGRKKYKKEEISRIFRLTEIAERNDPRVKKRKQEILGEKKAKKDAKKNVARQQREEEERKVALEKEQKEQEEKKKAEEVEVKQKQKAQENKKLRSHRTKLRSLVRTFEAANLELRFSPSGEEVEIVCGKITLAKIQELNAALDKNDPAAVTLFNQELANQGRGPTSPKAVEEPKPAVNTSRPWTEDEIALLSKGLHRYPGGSLNRWDQIAEFMGGTRGVKEIINKTKEGKAIPSKPSSIYQVEDAYNRFNQTKKKVAVEISAQASTRDDVAETTSTSSSSSSSTQSTTKPSSNGTAKPPAKSSKASSKSSSKSSSPSSTTPPSSEDTSSTTTSASSTTSSSAVTTMNANSVDNWSAEEQKKLEKALAAHPASMADRWERIGADVGKPKKDCILRYKFLVSKIKESKKS